ncbi:MAG: MBL fold metallo-hydrolase [Clostridia bacterium]|nr:MBL fold metallo-hydrolase [Clostridia bacterium]
MEHSIGSKKGPQAAATMARYECAPGIWEIDEFDCASVFLVIGGERALLVDTGVGIGDLRWVVEDILGGAPYEVVATHSHGDHIGGAAWFDPIWIHPADSDWRRGSALPTLDFRREYAALIRSREGKEYAYDPEKDIRPWPRDPVFRTLQDGRVFDLGGRRVSVIHCPGHTPGEIVLADDRTKTLLCGDACNCNWLLSQELGPDLKSRAKAALQALHRLTALEGSVYAADRVINSHHDYRFAGQPLAPEVLPDLVSCLESILSGSARLEKAPDPLSPDGAFRTIARFGRVMVGGIDP